MIDFINEDEDFPAELKEFCVKVAKLIKTEAKDPVPYSDIVNLFTEWNGIGQEVMVKFFDTLDDQDENKEAVKANANNLTHPYVACNPIAYFLIGLLAERVGIKIHPLNTLDLVKTGAMIVGMSGYKG